MSVLTCIMDNDGGKFMVGDAADGTVWFPPFPLKNSYTEQLSVIRDTKIRDDDVIMAGYGKCGSHWHYEILAMLGRNKAEYVPTGKAQELMEANSKEDIEALKSPRVLNTHVPFRLMPKEALEKKTKIIVLIRNPKDVCVSMFNHMRDWMFGGYDGTWDNFVELFLTKGVWYGSWFHHYQEWEREMRQHPDYPIFISAYEDLQKDPVGHIMKISNFLGLDRSEKLYQQIAEKCKFENLKKADNDVKGHEFPPGVWREGAPGFFRKGKVGDWKNWFSEEQSQQADQIYQEKMADTRFQVLFEI